MWKTILAWYNRYFDCQEAFILLFVIVGIMLSMLLFGAYIAPILASLVFAYLLDSIIVPMRHYLGMPRPLAVTLVYSLFLGLILISLIFLIPMLWNQMLDIVATVPHMVQRFHDYLRDLPAEYPGWVTQDNVDAIVAYTTVDSKFAAKWAQYALDYSLSSLSDLINALVYLILVPLVTLFMLIDKHKMIAWWRSLLPAQHELISLVGKDINHQLGGYIRGKFIELVIVWFTTYAAFWYFGLNYGFLLAFLVGCSVIIPYVGMVIVTVPIIFVGLWQWGFDSHFISTMAAYLVVQAIDGNILVPLLFSSVVNMHPVAIVAAVLVFGGLWGFWGLFFAIPLATVVRSVVHAWVHIGNRADLR